MALITSPLLNPSPTTLLNYAHRSSNLPPLTTNKCTRDKRSCLLARPDQSGYGNRTKAQAIADDNGAFVEAESRNYGKIFLSDAVVKRRRQVFWGREWNSWDIGTTGVVLAMHALCLFAPFYFTWSAFWVAFGLYVITGLLGITLSFHRNLSHRSFKLPKWLEYFCAYCGVQALQGNPIDWASTHRYHHQFCDTERDPHSPIEGFWFSHMNWLFDTNAVIDRCGEASNVGDLEKQPFYRFIRSTYILHPIALAVLLYAAGGFPFLVWGMAWKEYFSFPLFFFFFWVLVSSKKEMMQQKQY